MTDKLFKFISGKRLMERWGLLASELRQLCYSQIDAYEEEPDFATDGYGNNVLIGIEMKKLDELWGDIQTREALFFIDQIEKFEKKHPEVIKEKQEQSVPKGIVVDGSAPEYLRIAAEAWKELYKSGAYLKWKTGHIKSIIAWIKKQYPDIDDTPAKKIAQIINGNKSGGAPPRI